jgi:hypothetical protein
MIASVRGRDASYLAPPAQIRTSPIRAYGLYGAFLVNRVSAQHDLILPFFAFSIPQFLGSTSGGSILSSRPQMSIAGARNCGQGRRALSAAGGLSLTAVSTTESCDDRVLLD